MSNSSEPRFEILEEETHYPQANTSNRDETSDTETVEQTLEEKLANLCIVDETSDKVKNASKAKELGNELFKKGAYLDAIDCYTAALKICPTDEEYAYNRSVYFSNRAACLFHLGRPEESVTDCTEAITLSPTYVKALMRRAQALEKMDKLDEALRDYADILKIDPTIRSAQSNHTRLKKIVDERNEKLKAEMLDKLKGFGNTILGKFGLSTDNFQMVQDPTTGSYNINFTQNPGQNPGQNP